MQRPKGYPQNDAKECVSKHILETKLIGYVASNRLRIHIITGDKTPGRDGYLEFLDKHGAPNGEIKVQLKTLPKGKRKFSCRVPDIHYSKTIPNPFIYICVDNHNSKAYWALITVDLLKGKGKQKTVTLTFSDKDELSDSNNYYEAWQVLVKKGLSVAKGQKLKQKLDGIPSKSSPSATESKLGAVKTADDEAEFNRSVYKAPLNEAKKLLGKKMYRSAQAIYQRLLLKMRRDKTVPQLARFKALNNLASCYLNLGEDKLAGDNFIRAFEVLAKKTELAFRNRTLACMLLGDFEEGLKFIDSAITINPENNENYYLKAALFRKLGRFKDADDIFFEEGPDEN
jgi:tetratricopeptide (TPR) repeat protein